MEPTKSCFSSISSPLSMATALWAQSLPLRHQHILLSSNSHWLTLPPKHLVGSLTELSGSQVVLTSPHGLVASSEIHNRTSTQWIIHTDQQPLMTSSACLLVLPQMEVRVSSCGFAVSHCKFNSKLCMHLLQFTISRCKVHSNNCQSCHMKANSGHSTQHRTKQF